MKCTPQCTSQSGCQSDFITLWLKKVCGSENSRKMYKPKIEKFFKHVEVTPDELVAEWKKVKYDYKLREQFIDEWTDKIETYIYTNFENYTPCSRMQELAVITSFFKNCCSRGIPVEPKREKHTFVKYHNRDIKRKEIVRIIDHASPRDKAFFLMMAESGLRPYTMIQLRYKHIKQDFEVNRVPMMIDLPSELLKDRVDHRWTFIGEDGFNMLKKYLKPRLPLKNEDLIFQPRRIEKDKEKDTSLKTSVTRNTFSVIFSNLAMKLEMTEIEEEKKPKKLRLYCLRKYFMNNCRCDTAFREFWMGHKTTQTHYVSRDIERHREEYRRAYQSLKVFRPETELDFEELKEQIREELHQEYEQKLQKQVRDLIREEMRQLVESDPQTHYIVEDFIQNHLNVKPERVSFSVALSENNTKTITVLGYWSKDKYVKLSQPAKIISH